MDYVKMVINFFYNLFFIISNAISQIDGVSETVAYCLTAIIFFAVFVVILFSIISIIPYRVTTTTQRDQLNKREKHTL